MEAIKVQIKKGSMPTEKLRKKGARALSDQELLMILLGENDNEKAVEDILSLIDKGENFPLSSLINIPGVGKEKGLRILASLEFGRRKTNRKPMQFNHHADIYNEIRHFANRNQEQLLVLSMNGAFEILHTHIASIGYVDRAFFHPREIFSEPIKHGASQIVIAHNHPSGTLMPSTQDIDATLRILKAGQLLGIAVADHIIFTRESYYSLYESGTLNKLLDKINPDS